MICTLSVLRYLQRGIPTLPVLFRVARLSNLADSPQLFSWLPKELEPEFMRYKKHILSEYEQLSSSISDAHGEGNLKTVALRWEKLRPIADIFEELDVLLETDADIEHLVSDVLNADQNEHDQEELSELVRVERQQRATYRQALERQLLQLLAPFDPTSYTPGVCLELIAGAGGREAGLFARELLEMYRLLAVERGWRFQVVQESNMIGDESTSSGSEIPLSKARVEIVGEPLDVENGDCRCFGAYGQLRWEAGVHRVQRIPVTSKQHKIHTSTVAVSVLSLGEEISIDLPDSDLKWEFFRASGAGGQHVNRTDSAVRLTHLPTGTVVTCQRERSQHVNRRIALELLEQKLRDAKVRTHAESEDILRRSQVGHLDRSEKIRTYNFPQDRITDHRLGRSWNGMQRFMRQATGLSELIQALADHEQSNRLKEMLLQYRHDK
ncbi:Peptide chain release factor [Paragonimus heterotremus]|uniref:Peptide chain release factor n=1 Tax=Paragonimus heterotremus TaxID=100268 RepID=A0A8J4T3I9_9TREM|nr:Peptide chain release factor [Paragonimus heterotremus]